MQRISRGKKAILWGVCLIIIVILAIATVPVIPALAESPQANSGRAEDLSGFWETIKVNIISLAALTSALAAIFLFMGKIFKPIKTWSVNKIRKWLKIIDVDKKLDDKFLQLEKNANEHADSQRKEYAIISGQNNAIEERLDALLSSVDEISRKMDNIEDSQLAVLKDVITKTYYKYVKRRAIPIHEKENVTKMFEIYKSMRGNSYVGGIMSQIEVWEVLSGADIPVSNDGPGRPTQ